MSNTLTSFLARAIPKAAADLETALNRLPEDKRTWSPKETSRSALNQIAEIAILNGNVADTIANRAFPADFTMDGYIKQLAELSNDWPATKALLDASTAKVVAAIETVRDDELATEIDTPFAKLSIEQIISYPYWNICYHEGQINYIASILGCLD